MRELIFENIGYAMLGIMLIIILYIHYALYCDQTNRTKEILLFISALTFMIIFLNHLVRIKKREKNGYLDRVYQVKYSGVINWNNNAIDLFIEIMKNPIFAIY
ncbi:hypothetical protein [Megavirus chiliensis]|nr:hypothetical protein c7_L830 [Megavirus courdo7]AGD92640.1 hypothetical protein LBA_00722 [Megavirus lba]AUV58642.1 hypothetical protein [Bandra megavirus]